MNKGITNIIDYKYLLINKYKKLGLSEVETMLILVMEQLLEEGNELVTADLLALKMYSRGGGRHSATCGARKGGRRSLGDSGCQATRSCRPR